VGLFTVAYLAATFDLASLKPFSFDELTTYYMAKLPTAGDVWSTWFETGEAISPLVHLVTHVVGYAFGFSHVTVRLPSMVGFWFMCLCVFIFLRRRVCPMLAFLGMLVPVTVPLVYSYAYDARGYGMVLGFSSAAVVCWDLTQKTRWRRVALLALPVCLAGAIATHLYAILVVVPLAMGEIARGIERRRVDWWVWVGLMAACLVSLPANPIVSHIRHVPELTLRSHRAGLSELMELWSHFLSVSATYLGMFVVVCLCHDWVSTEDGPTSPTTRDRQSSLTDWVLVLAFVSLPAAGWLLANVVAGFVVPRFVIASVIGFSLGVPLLCRMAIRRQPEVALLLAGWVAATAVGGILASRHAMHTTSVTTEHIAAGRGCFRLLKLWERLPSDDLPIVVSDFIVFNQMHHYAPEALRRRLLFLADNEFGALIVPYISFYANVFGTRIEGLDGVLRSNRSFYLYDCGASARLPMVERLLGAGALLRDAGLLGTPDILLRRDLYRVSMRPGA
jgi:hypothetical protein